MQNLRENRQKLRKPAAWKEQTAGFISRETGAFTGVMLINSPEDRKRFCKEFGIKDIDIKIIY